MLHYFESQFKQLQPNVSNKVIIIGADCPHLGVNLIEQAFALLDEAPVVLGPSTDGGYYMIGMRNRAYPIFDSIDWGTSTVLETTKVRLNHQAIDYRLMDTQLNDVDEFEDLVELASWLKARASEATETPDNSVLLERVNEAISMVSNRTSPES